MLIDLQKYQNGNGFTTSVSLYIPYCIDDILMTQHFIYIYTVVHI